MSQRYATYLTDRQELLSDPLYVPGVTRRSLLKAVGSGIVVLLTVKDVAAPADAQESGRGGRGGEGMPTKLGAWLHIGENGTVTVYTGKVELGQNIRTSLAQVVAEELRLSVSSIIMVMGDTDKTPYDVGTFGSLTTLTISPQLRRAGACARELLLELAAKRWGVDPKLLTLADGKVTERGGGRSIGIGELAGGQELVREIAADEPVTPPSEWKVAGTSVRKVGGLDYVTGKQKFISDLTLPGMLYGKVLRPASFGATLKSVDASAAAAIPGVTVVRDGDFVGVTAQDSYTAQKAIDAIRAEWNPSPQISDSELFADFRKQAGPSLADKQVDLAPGTKRLARSYTVAYIAHVPLEPRAALAQWDGDKLTVWTGTQRPFGVRSELARAFSIPEANVRVLMPCMGSGYGGKHTGECAIEAARLARKVGKPVKLTWTRQEEFTWAYFRPAGLIDVAAVVSDEGKLLEWEMHNYNSGPAAIRAFYDIPKQTAEAHAIRSPLRQGSYRALAATANQFARETHIDELAHLVGMDPLEFRLKNIADPRLRGVVDAAAKRFGWAERKPDAGHGFGIACGFEKNGYVATCAEVAVEGASRNVRLVRTVTAFDNGPVVNPNHMRLQMEGMIIMGLGGAIFEAIKFQDGKITNASLHTYRVPRFSDMPAIESILIDPKDKPTAGGGETPMIALAPAIGAGIFQATGVRLRALPLAPNGVPQADAPT
jgi:isoquinoline 1-oxidoreductase